MYFNWPQLFVAKAILALMSCSKRHVHDSLKIDMIEIIEILHANTIKFQIFGLYIMVIEGVSIIYSPGFLYRYHCLDHGSL